MNAQRLALRAPDYIRIMSRLVAAHGWCGSAASLQMRKPGQGLTLAGAAIWAVSGRECLARNISGDEAERVADVIDHLEAEKGLDMSITEYGRRFAGANALNVSWEILLSAIRYETDLAVIV